MMRALVYRVLSKVAQSLRGSDFRLDENIPLSLLIGIGCRRLSGLLRALMNGIPIGKLVFLGSGVKLRARHLVSFGRGVSLGHGVVVDGLSRTGIRIGNHVSIGDYTRLEATGTITDIGNGILIGNNSGIGAFSFIGGAGGVKIGNDVIMGQWVSFHPENHNFDRIDIPIRSQGVNRKGIVVEDNCWIGAKVTFLDGAHVGHGSVIAAGALVRGYIPPFSVAAGVPARVIRSRKAPQLDK